MTTDTEERVDCYCVRFREIVYVAWRGSTSEAVRVAWSGLRDRFDVALEVFKAEAEVRMVEQP